MDTHLAVIPVRLDKDPFETRLDVVDVVIVLQQRGEGRGNRQGPCGRSGPIDAAQATHWVVRLGLPVCMILGYAMLLQFF